MTRIYHQSIYHLHHFILKLRQHSDWVYSLVIVSALLTLLNSELGELKATKTWSWLDIIGEGATAFFIAIWLLIMLAARSKGTTTSILALGFLMLYVANFQDLMDEFIQLPIQVFPWDSLIESLPIGLSLLTIGLVYWYKEQQLLHQFIKKRSITFENNNQINRETGLATMQSMLDTLTPQMNNSNKPLQLNLLTLQTNQLISEQPIFKRYCSDMLVNNLPENTKIYYLTKNNYAIVTELSSVQNNDLMHPLVKLLGSLNYYNKNTAYCLKVINEVHFLSTMKTINEVQKLVIDNIECKTRTKKPLTLQTSVG